MALLTSLISYWALDDAGGGAADSHGANPLTEHGSIASATGKIATCRDFEESFAQSLDAATNSGLNVGNLDFTVTAWVKAESFPTNPTILSKADGNAGNEDYRLDWFSSRFRFVIRDSAVNYQVATADALGAPSTGTWYFLVGWHDAAADTVNIQVNNGTVNSSATAGLGPTGTGGVFALGALGALGASPSYWDGLIDEVGFWKRTLTAGERTSLYNSGAGLAYPLTVGGGSFQAAWARNANVLVQCGDL